MYLQLELILTAATLCIAIIGVISGLFGMNLHNTHEDSYTTFVLVRCHLACLMSQKNAWCAQSCRCPSQRYLLHQLGVWGQFLVTIQRQRLTECEELMAGQVV